MKKSVTTVLFVLLFAVLTIALVFAVLLNKGGNRTESSSDPAEASSVTESRPDHTSVESGISSEPVSAEPQESSEPEKDKVVSFLGCPDNIIHPSVFYTAIGRAAEKGGTAPNYDWNTLHDQKYDFAKMYEYVADAVKNADVAYINQETLPGGTQRNVDGYPCFNTPMQIIDTVMGLGYDVVNLAHNHMLDSGDTSFLTNAAHAFSDAGATVIGYYEDSSALDNIPLIEVNGIKIAFLAYTYGTNGITLPASSKVVIPYFSEELLRRQIPAAREIADFVIVSAHWGDENSFWVNSDQQKYAELMCELGVDLVLDMHVHVVQPIEWKTSSTGHKTLVVYSLGNYISGMVAGKNMLAGMLSLDIVKSAETGEISMQNVYFIPTVTHYTAGARRGNKDTGYTDFMIYYLADYTQELAGKHGVVRYEAGHGNTLVGGGFSLDTLMQTLHKYIPDEFLPETLRSGS